jgi:hypothetical protein
MPVLSLSKRPANKKTIAGMARSYMQVLFDTKCK